MRVSVVFIIMFMNRIDKNNCTKHKNKNKYKFIFTSFNTNIINKNNMSSEKQDRRITKNKVINYRVAWMAISLNDVKIASQLQKET